MRIGIIGMGTVGTVLGRRWADAGHIVTFGVRDPDNPRKQAEAKSIAASLGPIRAAALADAILVAVPWRAVPDALKAAGDLTGKVLLDCTNPVNDDLTELTTGGSASAGQIVAGLAPQAHVVKIFNTIGATNFADPNYGGHRLTMFLAGDDERANKVAAGLASAIGFEPVALGPLKYSGLLESLAMTWIILARHHGFGRDFAIDVVRRPTA
jgi:8-hydroxy-5-deazaflavin:NADPH oxidoreductase